MTSFPFRGTGKVLKQEDVFSVGLKYYVSTVDTRDAGWETMVFPYDLNGNVDYCEVHCCRYSSEDKASQGHQYVVDNLGTLLRRT